MASRSSTERGRRASRALALALCLAALTSPRAAHADAREDAEAALRRGVALRRAGDDAEALEAFRSALALSPSARARAQIALAEQALALWLAAERDLALALAETRDPWIRQHREALEGAARVVAGKLAWVKLDAPPGGAEVRVNGARASIDEKGRVRVVAGLVTVEVRAPGYAPASRALHVAPEATAEVSFALQPAPGEAPPVSEAQTAAPSGGAGRTAGWILAGAGVAGIGAGAAFGLRAIAKKNERDADCAGGCSHVGVAADRAGRTAGLVSTLATLGGVAAAGAGVWLILDAPSPRSAKGVAVYVAGPSIGLSGVF